VGVPILAKRQSSRADIQTARTQAALDHSATAAAGRIAAHRFGQLVEELGMTVLETPTGEAVDGPRQVWEHPVDRLAASVPQEADGGVREEVGRMLDGNMGANVHYLDLSIVPLVLSMGFAEIELLRLRAAGGRLMRHTVHLADYQRGASRLLLLSQLRFLLVLVSVSVLTTVLISMTSGLNTRDFTLLCAYSTLGTALLAALVLVAVDRVRVALLGFWFAGCAIAVVLGASRLAGLTLSVEGGYLASCLILFGFLTALAVRTLRDPRALA